MKTLRKVFSQTNYDTAVIQSLPLYDSLKNIIISHMTQSLNSGTVDTSYFIRTAMVTLQQSGKTITFTAFIMTTGKQPHLVTAQDQMTKS